jgi:hypothetical protein
LIAEASAQLRRRSGGYVLGRSAQTGQRVLLVFDEARRPAIRGHRAPTPRRGTGSRFRGLVGIVDNSYRP